MLSSTSSSPAIRSSPPRSRELARPPSVVTGGSSLPSSAVSSPHLSRPKDNERIPGPSHALPPSAAHPASPMSDDDLISDDFSPHLSPEDDSAPAAPRVSCFSCETLRSMWSSFKLSRTKRILAVSCFISLMFIIATIIYFYITLNHVEENFHQIIHTDQVKENIQGLKQNLLAAESAHRGIIIAGTTENNSFEPLFNTSVRLVKEEIFPSLGRLMADNPFQLENLNQLRPLIDSDIAQFLSIRRNVTETGYLIPHIVLGLIEERMKTRNAIERLLDIMMAEENRLLVIRDHRASDSVREMIIIMFVSLLLCGVSILAGLTLGFDWDSRQLRDTNAKLQSLLKKAQEATKVKSLFLANMSHEIRTPMNGVFAMAELLQSTPLSDEQQDIVDTIVTSARLMMRLINDLLLFSKIEAGTFDLHRERFDLEHFMMGINEASATKAAKKGVEYVFQMDSLVPHLIFADSGRLRQVLVNLIDNAIKFTHRGRVSVRIRFVRRVNKRSPGQISGTPRMSPSEVPLTALRRLRSAGSGGNATPNRAAQPLTPGSGAAAALEAAETSAPPTPSPGIRPQASSRRLKNDSEADRCARFPICTPSRMRREIELSAVRERESETSPSPAVKEPKSAPAKATYVVSSAFGSSAHRPALLSAGLDDSCSNASEAIPGLEPPLDVMLRVADSPLIPPSSLHASDQPSHPQFGSAQDWIVFQIIDTGIGIPEHDTARLFEPFAQLDMSATKQYGGTGLGLSISKHLVHAMGGNLKFKSNVGVGSTFSFAIPMLEATPESLKHRQQTEQTTKAQEEKEEKTIEPKKTTPLSVLRHPAIGRIHGQTPGQTRSSPSRTGGRSGEASLLHTGNIQFAEFLPDFSKDPSAVQWHEDHPPALASDPNSARPTPQTKTRSIQPKANVALLERAKFLTSIASQPISPRQDASASASSSSASVSSPILHELLNTQSRTPLALDGASASDPQQHATQFPFSAIAHPSYSPLSLAQSHTTVPPPSSLLSASQDVYAASAASIPVMTTPEESKSSFFHQVIQSQQEAKRPSGSVQPPEPINTKSDSAHSGKHAARRLSSLNSGAAARSSPTMSQSTRLHHSESAANLPVNSSGFRMLLAEDNLINQKVARKLLERDGHSVQVVENGELALQFFISHPHDIDFILMDWFMPVRDGLSATAEIRARERETPSVPYIPIIAVTASALNEDRERCLQAGVDDILHKPIEIRLLQQKIDAFKSRAIDRRKFAPTTVETLHPVPEKSAGGAEKEHA